MLTVTQRRGKACQPETPSPVHDVDVGQQEAQPQSYFGMGARQTNEARRSACMKPGHITYMRTRRIDNGPEAINDVRGMRSRTGFWRRSRSIRASYPTKNKLERQEAHRNVCARLT